ncbi:MAG: UDP-N-acetylglucosamine 1-carboxyvinyltransferase [Clostridia bacterium]|nr:UDP-N-acetylglucosamine 1-carboxyvinyltransferase [Clostridia bacterium]
MQNLIIRGGRRLGGDVSIHGAKNSVLPLICSTVLLNGKSILHNCPALTDVYAALDILESLGIEWSMSGSDIEIISKHPENFEISEELMLKMRSSVMFLGAILSRTGRAVISAPGGCRLGPRPIDIHISALKKLGAVMRESGGRLIFEALNGLVGTEIVLDFPSVGATENIIMAGALASGVTVIYNAAREPEIKDLTDFLIKCGADISGGGTDTVVIRGVNRLDCAEHTVIPDRIEAATYMAAAAATGGNITLKSVIPNHFNAVSEVLRESGCEINCSDNEAIISAPSRLDAVKAVKTRVYPGFPTDAGPMILSALSTARGTSVISESIFENRFGFTDELSRFGARVMVFGKVAVVDGVNSLSAAQCNCTDLRGGAALIIAALTANGESTVGNLCHIMRGYQDLSKNLRMLGADITEM